ncbi:MAG: DUF6794 domain-containing protein [Bacteroidales bacterium]
MKHIYVILLVVGLSNCVTNIDQPGDLDDSVKYFEKSLSTKEKNDFKKLPEEKAVSSIHFSTGLWIRNNWIRGNKNPDLVNYFDKQGINHPDDISSIILTSLHRKLNNKDIDLNGQISLYKSYWKPILECMENEKKIAVENYNRFKIDSKIKIEMKVDNSGGERNAVIINCPNNNWTFNPDNDLMIDGIIKEKYFINDSSNVFFKVKIEHMNFNKTRILMKNVEIGDIFNFSLKGLSIK